LARECADEMIPESQPAGEPRLPPHAGFWMPDPSELDSEEGIGFFRDVWTIIDVPRSDAELVIQRERELLRAIDSLATTAVDFDRLARFVEDWDPDEVADEVSSAERSVLTSAIGDADSAEL